MFEQETEMTGVWCRMLYKKQSQKRHAATVICQKLCQKLYVCWSIALLVPRDILLASTILNLHI